jgi:UDP:flavonoid glycosyltransferase YjiC (YdhE family)
MATILAYTSPGLGHVLPISALLSELSGRGHAIHLRTFSVGLEIGQRLGFTTDTIDSRIEGIEHDDWEANNPGAALRRNFAVFGRRGRHEVTDLTDAIARVDPDGLLIDMMCWGALSVAEAGGIPWASFSPFTPFCAQTECPRTGRASRHCRISSDAFVTPLSGPW